MSCLSVYVFFSVMLFIRAFCVWLFCIGMFCLLVVLVKWSVLASSLARKTPLKMPNRGERIVSRKPRPKSV